MLFRFIPNQHGIDEIANGPLMAAFVNKNADRVLDAARNDGNTDRQYRGSLNVRNAQPTSDGMTAKVVADTPFWHLFEFGSIKNPPYRVLTHAVTTAGLKFKDH